MYEVKKALIVTDDSAKVKKMANRIVKALGEAKILIKSASNFSGEDLLPADAIFIGCEKPSPPSFKYLEILFQHINLADRRCGIFTPSSEEAVLYMTGMVINSDIKLNPVALKEANSSFSKEWTAKTISEK